MFSCIINMVLYKCNFDSFRVYHVNAYALNSVVFNVIDKWYHLKHLSVSCPTPAPSLGYRGDLTNLGVDAPWIGARYIVKSALCSHPLIGVPPPIYMGFDHRLTNYLLFWKGTIWYMWLLIQHCAYFLKCNGEIELKCYNGKRCQCPQGWGKICCQIPCKSMLIHEGGGWGWHW